jgi:hypothetical protein
MSIRSLLLSVLCVSFCGTAMAGPYKVGLSNVELTPPFPVFSWQYPAQTMQTGAYPADGLNLPLSVRAVYVANPDGSQPIVLVAADLVSLCPWDADFARDPDHHNPDSLGPPIPNLSRERVMINISHTHEAPGACDTSARVAVPWLLDPNPSVDTTGQGGVRRDGKWREWVRSKFVEAIWKAYRDAQPATLTFYRNSITVGQNRRNPQAGYDPTLDAVKIVGDDGIRRGVLFFYGMHPVGMLAKGSPPPSLLPNVLPVCGVPESDGCSQLQSPASADKYYHHPDYPGFARKIIEDDTPGNDVAIFFQAAGGDVNPTSAGICPGYCFTKNLGTVVGARVLDMINGRVVNAIEGEILPSQGGNTAYDRVWAAPFQTAAGTHRLGGSAGEPRAMDGKWDETPAAGSHWYVWADHFCEGLTGHGNGNPRCSPRAGVTPDTSLDLELQTLTVGKWRIAGLSQEPVGQHGLTLRGSWPQDWVSVAGYINREQNYLPTSAQLNEDDSCAATKTCTYGTGPFLGYEGFVAQLLNGNPAAWASHQTTTPSVTGSSYDLDAEIAHVLKSAHAGNSPGVNYAHLWHGTTARASSELDANRLAIAAINGDRNGIDWGLDPKTGSGWHDSTLETYPDWIEIDFHAPRTIEEIDVFTAQDGVNRYPPADPDLDMKCLEYGILDFDVQYLDTSVWSELFSPPFDPVSGKHELWVSVKNSPVVDNENVWRSFSFAPVTTRKIRLVVTRARKGYSRVVEIEAWGNPTSRPNVALASKGAEATASPSLAGRTAEAAINGDRKGIHWGSDPLTGSGWHDSTPNDFTDDWLEVAFPGPRTINQVDVFSVQDTFAAPVEPTKSMPAFTKFGVIDFQVKYWNGGQWVLVPGGNITDNTEVWRTIAFPPVTTSKLRVVVTKGGKEYSRIVEIEALTPYDFLSSVPLAP